MPQFGACVGVEEAGAFKAAGWDFIEGNVQGLLQGDKADDAWAAQGIAATLSGAALAMPAANCLVPGSLKIVGPDADLGKLQTYMTNVLKRARQVGMKTLVFGSGGARQVPEGFDRAAARQQIISFAAMSAPLAAQHGVTIVMEHLNKKECNIINTVAEAMDYVRAVNHPHFQCLVDSWHLWLEDEPLEHLAAAMPWIKHVHLADKEGRVAPGQSNGVGSDYRAFFSVLKKAGYDGRISVEAKFVPDGASTAGSVLAFIKQQWAGA